MSEKFDKKNIAAILEMLEKHDVTEFRLEREGEKISLKRGKQNAESVQQIVAPITQAIPQQVVAPQAVENIQAVAPAAKEEKNEKPVDDSHHSIKSPMVGTFYTKPAPDAEPFVQVGDTIKKGQVLCIVEAMKLMNEIESDVSGKVVEICLNDSQMVEYDEVIFKIAV